MNILLDSNSIAIFIGLPFTLTADGVEVASAQNTQYTTANCTVIDTDPPEPALSNLWKWENNAWFCTDQATVDAFYASQKEQYNKEQSNKRLLAYTAEADPIFFKWQRQEATQQEWLDKVAQIQARYPYEI
jgi:hypothetical protein